MSIRTCLLLMICIIIFGCNTIGCRKSDRRVPYILQASSYATYLYFYKEEHGTYPVEEGNDERTLIKVFCPGEKSCKDVFLAKEHLRGWYYKGDKSTFVFIGETRRYRSFFAERYSAWKIDPSGIYWKDDLYNANDILTLKDADTINFLSQKYLQPSDRKDPNLIFTKLRFPK